MTLIERITLWVQAVGADIKSKQDKLVSGTNIKTINGNSILGTGDISTGAGGGSSTSFEDSLIIANAKL